MMSSGPDTIRERRGIAARVGGLEVRQTVSREETLEDVPGGPSPELDSSHEVIRLFVGDVTGAESWYSPCPPTRASPKNVACM